MVNEQTNPAPGIAQIQEERAFEAFPATASPRSVLSRRLEAFWSIFAETDRVYEKRFTD